MLESHQGGVVTIKLNKQESSSIVNNCEMTKMSYFANYQRETFNNDEIYKLIKNNCIVISKTFKSINTTKLELRLEKNKNNKINK